MRVLIINLVISLIFTPRLGFCIETKHIYSTWETIDADKLASLWFILKFKDPEAVIKFYPKGTLEMRGVQVDTPLSKFRRTQRLTAYESLIKAYNVSDPSLIYIGKLIHDIEINIWRDKTLPETPGFELILKGIILSNKDPQKCLSKAIVILDALYEGLKFRNSRNGRSR